MALKGKTKREVVLEFRHAEILEAARKVFARKGYARSSVEDIARAARMGKGTLYLYYPSKYEIYKEALRRGMAALCDELERKTAGARTSEGKIRAFIAAKLGWFEENPELFKIYHSEFAEAMCRPGAMHREFDHYHARQMKLLTDTLRKGIREKQVRKLPVEAAASAILNLTRGIVTQRLLGWSKTRVQSDIEFLFDLAWKGIACR